MAAQTTSLPPRPQLGMMGLRLVPNHFTVERGAVLVASNAVIPSKDVLESRRGQPKQQFIGTSAARVRAMHYFAGSLLAWRDTDNVMAFDTSGGLGTFVDLTGTYVPPAPATLGMKFADLSKSSYFTTSLGPYALASPSSTPRQSGTPRPLNFLAFDPTVPISTVATGLTGNPGTGWMSVNASVTYRALIGLADANNVIRLSAPCGRILVSNPADVSVAIGGLTRVASTVTVQTPSGSGYRSGDVVKMSTAGEANFPNGNKTVATVTATTFTYTEAGAAASSTVLQTFTSGTKNVQVSVMIPAGLTAGAHFIQLYRSLMSPAAGADSGDETRQVFERFVTATDITNGYVVIQDTCPESLFLGPNLYTNPLSGEGTDQENDRPPISQDICIWDSRLWMAQTVDKQRLTFRILGIGSPGGLQAGDVVCVGPQAFVVGSDWHLTSQWGPSQNITYSVSDLLLRINSTKPAIRFQTPLPFYAFSLEDGTVYPASVELEEQSIGGAAFYAACSRASAVSERLPLPVVVSAMSRTSNVVTVTATAHGYANGASVMMAVEIAFGGDLANFPPGLKTNITVIDANNFSYAEVGSNATSASAYYTYPSTYGSSNNPLPLRFSKQLEPESCPVDNFLTGLPDNAVVLRVLPLRDKLYVFLQYGDIYSVSGTYPYQVVKVDGTATLLAPDTLVEHAGRLHCLSTQGVVAVSDGGVEVLSYDIEPGLDPIEGAALATLRQYAFAVSYEADRQYQLWLPTAAGQTSAKVAYVFNSLVKEFTTWSLDSTCGLLNPLTARLVLGCGDENTMRVENKGYARADYVDGSVAVQSTSFSSGNTIQYTPNATSPRIAVGDYISTNFTGFGFPPYSLQVTGIGSGFVTVNNASVGNFIGVVSPTTITFAKPITCKVAPVPDFAGVSDAEKQWREMKFHFAFFDVKSPVFSFVTEKTTTPVTGSPSLNAWPNYSGALEAPALPPVVLRVDVPEDCDRAVLLYPSFTTAEPLSLWRLCGMTSTSEAGSERTGE